MGSDPFTAAAQVILGATEASTPMWPLAVGGALGQLGSHFLRGSGGGSGGATVLSPPPSGGQRAAALPPSDTAKPAKRSPPLTTVKNLGGTSLTGMDTSHAIDELVQRMLQRQQTIMA